MSMTFLANVIGAVKIIPVKSRSVLTCPVCLTGKDGTISIMTMEGFGYQYEELIHQTETV